jgi:mono/diheme cytochrome c family protein
MTYKSLLTGTLVLGVSFAPWSATLQGQSQAVQTTKKQKPAVHKTQQPAVEEGQRIFEQNCSRCHTAPEGFSPRISGTIVHHMRVRASLSKHDQQELLRFFNP